MHVGEEVVLSSEFAEAFTITRATGGAFQAGGWAQGATDIPSYGVVNPSSAKQLEMLPEGDRPAEAMTFFSVRQLFTTDADASGTSDVLTWQSTKYRVLAVWNYSNRGYYMAIAERMSGA